MVARGRLDPRARLGDAAHRPQQLPRGSPWPVKARCIASASGTSSPTLSSGALTCPFSPTSAPSPQTADPIALAVQSAAHPAPSLHLPPLHAATKPFLGAPLPPMLAPARRRVRASASRAPRSLPVGGGAASGTTPCSAPSPAPLRAFASHPPLLGAPPSRASGPAPSLTRALFTVAFKL
eukprot:5714554-Pyramimonas_sp.AAC.1